ncbi:MAG: hypothetical protein ACR2PA_24375, partial [Hyphomicrobiaceae bacterium]
MPVTDATVPYRTRLWVVFASHARTAVILRRGPRKHFHLISWDLNRDTFTHGQWMRGFVRLWDLSPNGEYLVYWAHQYHPTAYWRRSQLAQRDPAARASYDPMVADRQRRSPTKLRKRRKVPRYLRQQTVRPAKQLRKNEGVWTAISRPPYFTALAIWPSFGHWTGGGTFRTDNFLVLNEGPDDLDAIENVRMPNRFSVHSYRDFAAHQQWPLFSARHGWQ